MSDRRAAMIALCGVLVMACGGCFLLIVGGGAAAGAGAATYYMGKLEQTLHAPLPRVYDAAAAVLREQGLDLEVQKLDKLTGHLEAQYADGKRVRIDLLTEPPDYTAVTVRVGLVPDKDRAMRILEGMKQRL